MKVLTVFGTRPEIIRLSRIIPLLDSLCDHVIVHTGQNYEESLSDIFLRDLGVRTPNANLGIRAANFADQAGRIIREVDAVIERESPDRILILGDTNSALSAIPAARRRIPVFHMEAGNRCYDDRVPEEVNRRLIDHASAVLLPYTHRSKENLVREGIERERIFVTGNPIHEVLEYYREKVDESGALEDLGVQSGSYGLVTLHRAENVDDPRRLSVLIAGLGAVAERHGLPLLVSVHPRTREKLERGGIRPSSKRVRLLDPMGFFTFVRLEKDARIVITDSGTVQEECAIFRVPNVTIRDVTERPETIEHGTNILSGARAEDIQRAVAVALECPREWEIPTEYVTRNVSTTVVKIVLGYLSLRAHRDSVVPDPCA